MSRPDNTQRYTIFRPHNDERGGADDVYYEVLIKGTESLLGYVRRRSFGGQGHDCRWVFTDTSGNEVLGPNNRYLDRYRNDIFEALDIAVGKAMEQRTDEILKTIFPDWAD